LQPEPLMRLSWYDIVQYLIYVLSCADLEITDFDLKKREKEEKLVQLREQAAALKVSAPTNRKREHLTRGSWPTNRKREHLTRGSSPTNRKSEQLPKAVCWPVGRGNT
jgi:hypothetical protein